MVSLWCRWSMLLWRRWKKSTKERRARCCMSPMCPAVSSSTQQVISVTLLCASAVQPAVVRTQGQENCDGPNTGK